MINIMYYLTIKITNNITVYTIQYKNNFVKTDNKLI